MKRTGLPDRAAHLQRSRPEDRRSRLAITLVLAVLLLSCTTPSPSTPSTVSSEANSQSGGGNSQAGPDADTSCLNGIGFWKNHPALWKLSSLTLAGVTYRSVDLSAVLGTPAAGDASLTLAHALIAARLNVANAAAPPESVAAALASADDWMQRNHDVDGVLPFGVRAGAAKDEAIALAQTLNDFNQGNIPPLICVAPLIKVPAIETAASLRPDACCFDPACDRIEFARRGGVCAEDPRVRGPLPPSAPVKATQ